MCNAMTPYLPLLFFFVAGIFGLSVSIVALRRINRQIRMRQKSRKDYLSCDELMDAFDLSRLQYDRLAIVAMLIGAGALSAVIVAQFILLFH